MANPAAICTLQRRKKQETNEDKFKFSVLGAVEESFSSLSNLDKQEIYFHLENAFMISKQEIPFRMKDFVDAIEQIFGIGAKLIEIRIVEALHRRIPDFIYTPKRSVVTLKEYTASLRTFLLQPS